MLFAPRKLFDLSSVACMTKDSHVVVVYLLLTHFFFMTRKSSELLSTYKRQLFNSLVVRYAKSMIYLIEEA